MRNRKTRVLAVLAVLTFCIALAGCHTMHFDHTGDGVGNTELSEWHHDGILQLVEFSDPVDLKARCDGKNAKSHTVERTFLNGLASGISYGLYDGWTVKIDCP